MQTKAPSARVPNIRKISTLAVLSAIAFVVMWVGRIPVVLFLKYDPKDVIITISGFLYGPLSAALVSFLVSLLEMFTVSETGVIGFVMNVLASCAFACPAALIYKKNRSVSGAVAGLVSGWILATVVMLLWNYLITPLYMGVPREQVVQLLLPAFLPFNLLKGGLNAALTLLLYKPLVKALRHSNLIPEREGSTATGKINTGVMLVAAFLLITCILAILVLQGIL